MANVLVKESSLENIADAIRSKNGQTTKYKPAQMADAITAISGGGDIAPTGTKTINITQNGTVTEDVTNYASAQVNVNVPNPSTGTKQITTNGTHDVTQYASAQVNVPNSYASSDEGKVVNNGALTAQTSRQITSNGTVDTTLNDEVVVNVPTGITPSGSQTFTENGTYDVTSLAQAVVNVASGGGVEKHETNFTLATATKGHQILPEYIDIDNYYVLWAAIFPAESTNTALNTVFIAAPYNTADLIDRATPNGLTLPVNTGNYGINDQSYNSIRWRSTWNNMPVGNYTIRWYGVKK